MSALGSPARPPRDSGNSTLPPPSPSRADSDRFQLAENARLALEAKSAQVEGLKVKLAAAEAALTERDERDAETQRERASSTHAGVMDEADRLGDEMKGALGNVKAFMRRAWTGEKGGPHEDESDAGDMNRHGTGTPSAMRSKAKTSIVEKPSARGAYVRHPDASPRVGFVGDREQRRLEKEGEVVADNARLRREVVELEQRLARLARVARSAHDAAESRFEEERRMRIDAEKLVERLRAASGDGSNALVEELETSRQLCRDVLLVTRACANVSQADPNAVVAALPALATLASNKRGDSALILATNGVPRHAAAAIANPTAQINTDPRAIQEHFEDFYEDIFEELAKFGELEGLNVCDNTSDHLIGNVYVKFREEESALAALNALSGRFYSGRPILCEFSPVTDFRESTCRQYEEQTCNRGGYCNFMHLKPISRQLRKILFGRYKRRDDDRGGRDDYNNRSGRDGRSGGYDRDDRRGPPGGGPPGRGGGYDDRRGGGYDDRRGGG